MPKSRLFEFFINNLIGMNLSIEIKKHQAKVLRKIKMKSEEKRKRLREILQAVCVYRHNELSDDLKFRYAKYILQEKKELKNTYFGRCGAEFHKQLLLIFQTDPRIKNYMWYYYRRKSRRIPLEKELQVLDVIIDNLKLNKHIEMISNEKETINIPPR